MSFSGQSSRYIYFDDSPVCLAYFFIFCFLYPWILFPSRENQVARVVSQACTPECLSTFLISLFTISYVCEFIAQDPENVRSIATRIRGLPVVHSVGTIDSLATCCELKQISTPARLLPWLPTNQSGSSPAEQR